MLTLRPHHADDAGAMGQLLAVLGYPADDGPTMLRRLQQLDRGAPYAVLVAELAGEIVGWIHVTQVLHTASAGYAEVHVLTVAEAHQGHGIGRRLLEAGEQWVCETLGPLRMRLGSGVHRTEAHKFYEHLGYAKRSTFVFQKEPAVSAL